MTICLELEEHLVNQALQVSGLPTSQAVVESALRLFIASCTQSWSEVQEEFTLPEESTATTTASDWSNEPFLGMWKNREEMKDSVEWIRQLRRNEWTRFK